MGVLHLKEVECSNYRSYGDGEIFQFQEGFNIILGGNNSGKSNIIKGIGVIFEKLRNLTHIVSKEYLLDEEGQVKYELPPETPNISDEEYHNRNQGLPIRLRLTLSIGNKDLEYLGKIKYLLKSSQHGKKQPTDGLDRTFAGKVKEVDFIFEISTHSSGEVDRRQKASMVLRFDEELNETKLSINNYFPDKFSIDKLTNLLKDRIIIFPEFRNKPEVRQSSDIVVDPSGLNLPLVLYNLKNRREPASQRKFDEIVKTFKDLFDMKLHVSEGHLLEFIKNDGTIISAEGVGGGLIEILNMLTHIMLEENKIIIIDEPESHLHPQGRRLLKQILTEHSNRNQLIIISHSSELFNLEEVDRVTLVRQNEDKSELYRVNSEVLQDPYIKKSLTKLRRAEYKELFFAKKVLLVEGETEFGAIPIFASKLNYNFDKNSISTIHVHGNYFVVFARILQDLHIPYLILCDADVLMNISKTLNIGHQKIKTSSLFSLMNWLQPLSSNDHNKLRELSKFITRANSIKWTRSKEYKVLQELSTRPEIPYDISEKAHKIMLEHQQETYDLDKRADIEKFMLKLARKPHINIKILESDFEGIFKTDRFSSLLESLTYQYGQDKVLLGICLASEISRQNIPNDIREIINKLKSA